FTPLLALDSSHFFFTAPSLTDIYTLSLHDALPILSGDFCRVFGCLSVFFSPLKAASASSSSSLIIVSSSASRARSPANSFSIVRSEEHTSELQSHLNLVCRLLLEKKK